MTGLLDKFNIENKVIIITGGEGIIGGNLAFELAGLGARICIIGINEPAGQAIKKRITDKQGHALFYNTNVLNRDALIRARNSIISEWGTIDILINAAGGNSPAGTVGERQSIFDINIDDFRAVSELNLDGTVIPSLVFGEHMSEKREGVILNFSSMTAGRAVSRVAAYSAAKSSVENFTRWMATEMAFKFGDKIRVNAIAPGFLVSRQNRDLLLTAEGSPTDRGRDIIRHTPFGRFGEPDELTGTVLWLISDASSFVTGAVIPVDGGFSAYSGV